MGTLECAAGHANPEGKRYCQMCFEPLLAAPAPPPAEPEIPAVPAPPLVVPVAESLAPTPVVEEPSFTAELFPAPVPVKRQVNYGAVGTLLAVAVGAFFLGRMTADPTEVVSTDDEPVAAGVTSTLPGPAAEPGGAPLPAGVTTTIRRAVPSGATSAVRGTVEGTWLTEGNDSSQGCPAVVSSFAVQVRDNSGGLLTDATLGPPTQTERSFDAPSKTTTLRCTVPYSASVPTSSVLTFVLLASSAEEAEIDKKTVPGSSVRPGTAPELSVLFTCSKAGVCTSQ